MKFSNPLILGTILAESAFGSISQIELADENTRVHSKLNLKASDLNSGFIPRKKLSDVRGDDIAALNEDVVNIEEELSIIEKSICGDIDLINARCLKDSHPEVYRKSNAVLRLKIWYSENGYSSCTAWLAGPNNFIITNNHCISSQEEADRTYFEFNYESHGGNCEKNGSNDDAQPEDYTLGAQMVYTNADWDLTILKIEGDPVSKYGYLEIEEARPEEGTQIFIPQHPQGRDKSIGLWDDHSHTGYCKIEDYSQHLRGEGTDVEAARFTCDVDLGSSGSPVISLDTMKVVALFLGWYGEGGCHGKHAHTMSQMYSTIAGYIYQGLSENGEICARDKGCISGRCYFYKCEEKLSRGKGCVNNGDCNSNDCTWRGGGCPRRSRCCN